MKTYHSTLVGWQKKSSTPLPHPTPRAPLPPPSTPSTLHTIPPLLLLRLAHTRPHTLYMQSTYSAYSAQHILPNTRMHIRLQTHMGGTYHKTGVYV